jgi:hypothetical protein
VINKKDVKFIINNVLISIAGFLIPVILLLLFYLISGHIKDFFDALYFIAFDYPAKKDLNTILSILLVFIEKFDILLMFFISGLMFLIFDKRYRFILLPITIWGLFTLVSVLSPGRAGQHYWFQFWPILAIIISFNFKIFEYFFKFLNVNKINIATFFILLTILITSIMIGKAEENFYGKEEIFEIAKYLKLNLKKDEKIFPLGGGSQILYYLLDIKPLGRKVSYGLTYYSERFTDISKNPRYIILSEYEINSFKNHFGDYFFTEKYKLIKIFKKIKIFEKNTFY